MIAQHKILDLKGVYVVSKNGYFLASCPFTIGGI